MEFLQTLHGSFRWYIAIVALIVIIKFAIGWLTKGKYSKMDRRLLMSLTGLMDLNLIMGLILLFGLDGGFTRNRVDHAVTMILAVVAAHFSARWKNSSGATVKFRNQLITVIVALALVMVGVTQLRGGWGF